MNTATTPLTVTVPLSLSAHSRAEQYRHLHANSHKAKQVYLNTLAVHATSVYLQQRGFAPHLEASDSANPALQALLDVADVCLDQGRLECRPVRPGADVVSIPADVSSDRIGYVAVRLHESLRQATLLGFADTAAPPELPLQDLRSLEELPDHILQYQTAHAPTPRVNLNQWLQHLFEDGWQAVETLLSPAQAELAFSFRSASPNSESSLQASDQETICRVKALSMGQREHEQITLLVKLTPSPTSDLDISVEVYPNPGQPTLPQGLQLIILDEADEAVMTAVAKNSKSIALQFSSEPGEQFRVKTALNSVSIVETFTT